MAGETIKTSALCLAIRPWSQTSHIVTWITPRGKISSVVKGAARAKSFFLGQYDLNYTCEILYYARAKGELHALKECFPLELRESLRSDFRLGALAEYFRSLVLTLAPSGSEAEKWYSTLESALDDLKGRDDEAKRIAALLSFERRILELEGLLPELSNYDKSKEIQFFSIENGTYEANEGRLMRIATPVAKALENPENEKNPQILLDAARVIGVFYTFHLDTQRFCRREILNLISNKKGTDENED